jgi:sigma-B regulation protein RsbU (phosphoserine phosphatase)
MALGESGFLDWRSVYRKLGVAEKLFLAVLLPWVAACYLAPNGALRLFLQIAVFFLGAWVVVRLARVGIRRMIWKLSNRLYVAYVFIAVVPVCLIAILAGIGAYMFTSQVAVYLVTSELDRRTMSLENLAGWLLTASEARRNESLREMGAYSATRYPGLEVLIRDKSEIRYPEDARIEAPPGGWGKTGGMVDKGGQLYAWAHAVSQQRDVTITVPLTFEYLSELVPHLGEVTYLPSEPAAQAGAKGGAPKGVRLNAGGKEFRPGSSRNADAIPPAVNRADIEVEWITFVPAAVWDHPPQMTKTALQIRTRFSAVYRTLTGPQADLAENLAALFFLFFAILFLLMELVALIIGVSLTRTITGAVQGLYEGTQKIRVGNFAHRIGVRGDDQLADLGSSFNRMTEDLERLVAVAKEKERLQAEIELAREVQAQLYPKALPSLKTLDLLAACTPARMVSGDYFDYQKLLDNQCAMAVGDVAGKGISAALLMATVASSLRTQLRNCMEQSLREGANHQPLPTSQLVVQLNKQIYNDTAPEKYLTLYFGIYDDETGILTYTNAGHLPPILIRRGEVKRLDVNGTVVGAFPFSEYGGSSLKLESGDLLVCYTDGITEPENDYEIGRAHV